MASGNLTFNEQLLMELGVTRENGASDSSILNIEDAVFCGIPDYLSTIPEDRVFPDGRDFKDPSYIERHAEEIIDRILREPLPDIDAISSWISNPDNLDVTSSPKETYSDEEQDFHPGGNFGGIGDASLYDSSIQEEEEIEFVEPGSCRSAIIEFAAKTDEYPEEPYEIFVEPGQDIDDRTILGKCWQHGEWRDIRSIFSQGTVRKDPEDGGFGRLYKTVCSRHIIIDCYELANNKSYDGIDMKFLCENPKFFNVMQKRLEDSQTAMGLIMFLFPYLMYLRLVASFASLPEVEVNFLTLPFINSESYYTFGGSGYTSTSTTSEDISSESSSSGGGTTSKKDKDSIGKKPRSSSSAGARSLDDRLNYIDPDVAPTEGMAHDPLGESVSSTYNLNLGNVIYGDILSDDGSRRIFVDGTRLYIEDEFTRYITQVYEPRRDKFLADLKKIYGADNDYGKLKATMGNPTKLKEIGSKILDARNSFFNDVLMMMKHPEFRVPKYEEDPEYYWYTSQMHRTFGFKIMRTYLNDGEYSEAIEESFIKSVDDSLSIEPDEENEYEASELGNKLSSIKRGESNLIGEDGMTFRTFFSNMARSLHTGGLTALERELKSMLIGYSHRHKTYGDAREDIKKEIQELTVFFKKCLEIAGGLPGQEVEVPMRIDSVDFKEDPFLKIINKKLSPEAIWPYPPIDYEYRGFTYQKYTFPNIDAMMSGVEGDDWIEAGSDIKKEEVAEQYLTEKDLKTNLGDLTVPDADSVSVDTSDAEELYGDKTADPKEEDEIIELSDMRYWWKYLGIATIVGIPFLATGLIITAPSPYILFPCVYIPLTVISISKCGLILVIGLAIRGLSINLMMIVVNMHEQHNSLMFPTTLLLTEVRDQAILKINSALDMIPMIADSIMSRYKSNNVALLKQNKRYNAQMTGLKALNLPGKNTIIRDIKEEIKEDTRMAVNRLESDVQNTYEAIKGIKTSATDVFSNT